MFRRMRFLALVAGFCVAWAGAARAGIQQGGQQGAGQPQPPQATQPQHKQPQQPSQPQHAQPQKPTQPQHTQPQHKAQQGIKAQQAKNPRTLTQLHQKQMQRLAHAVPRGSGTSMTAATPRMTSRQPHPQDFNQYLKGRMQLFGTQMVPYSTWRTVDHALHHTHQPHTQGRQFQPPPSQRTTTQGGY